MCGIIGLRLKDPELWPALGELTVPMLDLLASRGPDSTGVAIYRRDAPAGWTKYSLSAPADDYDWDGCVAALRAAGDAPAELRRRGRDAVIVTPLSAARLPQLLAQTDPAVRLFGHGTAIEVCKDIGPAGEVCARHGIAAMAGYQAVGHTRMATESAVTIEHSHPFAVATDLALVHNGSFSNYASVRRELADGAGLDSALRSVLKAFDGFFTLLVTTERTFAVVRDSFACKPMVVAETAGYVAVASEYVALAGLPGVDKAHVFEPMPEEIYTWQD
jgi:glutamate synthase domain-containing protein 1